MDDIEAIMSGFAQGYGHFQWFLFYYLIDPILKLSLHTSQATERSKGAGGNDIQVVAVGYGRTGTYSLTQALEIIGHPTLHTQELYKHGNIMEMWMEKVVEPSIYGRRVLFGDPDWDMITSSGFTAVADFPSSLYFTELMLIYPNSKFILTTKGPGRSDDWFRSWEVMTAAALQPIYIAQPFFTLLKNYGKYFRWLLAHVNDDPKYLWKKFPIHENQNKVAAIASYEEHNRMVRETIPADRLLEFNMDDGWEPLCQFLNISKCPQNMPFPKANKALGKKAESIATIVCSGAFVSTVIFALAAVCFRFFTGKTFVQWFYGQTSLDKSSSLRACRRRDKWS